jgi:hypothetical protein
MKAPTIDDPGPLRDLTHAARVDRLVALEKLRSWVDAEQLGLLAVMAADPTPNSSLTAIAIEKDWIREDVACALRLSAATVTDRLHLATTLTRRLPATLTALRDGDITVLHARVLAEATLPLDDEVTAEVQARVLPGAATQTRAEFRRVVHREVARVDARAVEERHRDAMAERRVVCTPGADGMAELWARLPADAAASLITALDALASDPTLPDPTEFGLPDQGIDCRTADQRRADALTLLANQVLHHGAATAVGVAGAGSWQGQRPSVQVTIALSTLLGLDQQPGELDRHGPIPVGLARRIAADPTGTWRRLITDDHGQLLDYGRHVYRPPANLRDHVITRDGTCRMPGCHRPARRSHLDHRQPWAESGQHGDTTADNLHALCGRHHRLKHDAGWTVTRAAGGATEWTAPTGHRYTKPAGQLPIDHTTDPPPPF